MAAGDGLVSMTPSSIAHSGTSASINADGGVDFTAVTELNLNGVFTSDYDNYLIVFNSVAPASQAINMRYRAAGTDASGANYAFQVIEVYNTSVIGARTTGLTSFRGALTSATLYSGDHLHIYGPALAQPTCSRNVSAFGQNDAYIADYAATHSLSTAYDGITFLPVSSNFTGNVHVFGYEE